MTPRYKKTFKINDFEGFILWFDLLLVSTKFSVKRLINN